MHPDSDGGTRCYHPDGLDTGQNKRLGAIIIMKVARSLPDIEDLASVGDGAK